MAIRKKILVGFGVLAGVALVVGGVIGFRAFRLYNMARDWRTQVRYLIDSGESIGSAPAADTFSASYLEAVFGNEPELLAQLKASIAKGIANDPGLNLGEVAAMIVTYHKTSDGKINDVVAHVFGGFPLGRRKPGFHRDGFFAEQLDSDLWQAGNQAVGFLGRDMILFAGDDEEKGEMEIIESVFSGDVMPLVKSLDTPLYYTAVFPDPSRVVPLQMRRHVQAFIVKGYLSQQKGEMESVVLTPSSKSATYSMQLLHDMRLASLLWLRGRWRGVMEDTLWGPQEGTWWAFEMANTIEQGTMEKEDSVVRMRMNFDRVMVNATLKSVERLGRDYAQQKRSLDERIDPRLVDASLRSDKPLHYWSNEHKWGPDWPFAGPRTNDEAGVESAPANTPAVTPTI